MFAVTARRFPQLSSSVSRSSQRAYATVPPAGPASTKPQAGGIKTETMIVGGIGAVLVYYIGKSMFASSDEPKDTTVKA
ncbi:hypothetical protein JCM10908_002928 [Rhodotorula pacifica]|uniref:uncharacterized protein n=1 Tax=Rhodotorula pacifica TaxID=1495444 RepID=UPI0031781268